MTCVYVYYSYHYLPPCVPSWRMKVQMLYGGHFVLAVKKILKCAKVAPGGVGFRTCSSNIINNKTLAIP